MPQLFYIIVFFFGAAIGSFAAASVWRIENKKPILSGRSECVRCGYKLKFFDLVPVAFFIILRGKCRKCKKPIEITDFLAEIVCGALFVLAFYIRAAEIQNISAGFVLSLLRDWIFLSGLLFLFLYDYRYRLIPDAVVITLTIAVFALNLFLGWNILNLLLAILAGGGFFLLQYLVSRGKWIGGGDIGIGALLGAALGWPNVVFALFSAYILGGAAGAYLLLRKKKQLKSRIAFGTFLALGGAIALFWGEKIILWYRHLFNF